MLVGHLRLSSLFSECKSFPGLLALDRPHHISFFYFRIAIWDRNIFVSLLALGLWLVGLSLNIHSTYSPVVSTMISFSIPKPAKV